MGQLGNDLLDGGELTGDLLNLLLLLGVLLGGGLDDVIGHLLANLLHHLLALLLDELLDLLQGKWLSLRPTGQLQLKVPRCAAHTSRPSEKLEKIP